MTGVMDRIRLSGRTALVTGAAGGLGVVISETLAELGAALILVDRPGVDCQKLAQHLADKYETSVEIYECDLEFSEQRLDLIRQIHEKHQNLSVLVNNAAFVGTSDLGGWATSFENQSIETWNRAMNVNLTAPFHLTQGLTSLLKKSIGANVINIGSIYGHYGPDWSLYEGTAMSNPAAYGASKGGLAQLTRWLATTLGPDIRVNLISPGGIFRNQPNIFVEKYSAKTPLARMATENDFSGALAFLASDLSGYVTGQTIAVDGGWGIW